MSESTEDFWPDQIPDPTDPQPVRLLKDQARLLGLKTRGEVEGIVRVNAEEGTVYYSLSLKASALGDYLYKLLEIAHPAILMSKDGYPITAQSTERGPQVTIANDVEFREWLRSQLSSSYVASAISNLQRYIQERKRPTRVS